MIHHHHDQCHHHHHHHHGDSSPFNGAFITITVVHQWTPSRFHHHQHIHHHHQHVISVISSLTLYDDESESIMIHQ
eukprot:2346708-Karenia_brevis.AAC.1